MRHVLYDMLSYCQRANNLLRHLRVALCGPFSVGDMNEEPTFHIIGVIVFAVVLKAFLGALFGVWGVSISPFNGKVKFRFRNIASAFLIILSLYQIFGCLFLKTN